MMCNYVIASTFLVFFSYKRKEWRRCWCRRRRHCERREYKKGRWKNEIKWNVEKKKKNERRRGASIEPELLKWGGGVWASIMRLYIIIIIMNYFSLFLFSNANVSALGSRPLSAWNERTWPRPIPHQMMKDWGDVICTMYSLFCGMFLYFFIL